MFKCGHHQVYYLPATLTIQGLLQLPAIRFIQGNSGHQLASDTLRCNIDMGHGSAIGLGGLWDVPQENFINIQLRILAMYEAKNSKICNFWTIWPVIQQINDHLQI